MTILNKFYRPLTAASTQIELRKQTQKVVRQIEGSELDAFSWIQQTPPALQGDDMADQLLERPLVGLPIAVKEVIDVAGAPISYGCDAFAGRVAVSNAEVVTKLEVLGAQVIGITRSTEMAIARETTTRNPWSPHHSPGASSSGSAAAVGAGLVPFALGTQTIGSVIRPAAYCGVIGFKPSIGTGSLSGILSLSPTLDHVGFFSDSLERMTEIMSLMFPSMPPSLGVSPRFVFIEPWFECAGLEPLFAKQRCLEAACAKSGLDWVEKSLDLDLITHDAMVVNTILCFEMFKNWGYPLLNHPDVSDELKSFLRLGEEITPAEYEACLKSRLEMIELIEGQLDEGDIIVFPSVLGLPPKLGQGTGSRDPQRLWTLLGMPALNLPVGWDKGFPLNLQLIARRGEDRQLLAAARVVSCLVGQTTPAAFTT
ncbi:hypothetical protein BKP64_01710 [Marinobacter salinus]|uniref:Amidase domain-containing protein n=1 Tax=Marinobacter salinus TaxID=1874317 RepID=A0A1D9GHL6_9GAMM|nr:amidase [Marinobacter salinus]AOY86995.1 hypothetical protein BKP64_01710 [Marinobacter salinus]